MHSVYGKAMVTYSRDTLAVDVPHLIVTREADPIKTSHQYRPVYGVVALPSQVSIPYTQRRQPRFHTHVYCTHRHI